MIKRHTSTPTEKLASVIKGVVFTLLQTGSKKHATFSTEWWEGDFRGLIPVRAKLKGNSFQKIGTIGNGFKFQHFGSIAGTFELSIFKLFWEGLKMSHLQTNIELWNPCKCMRCGRQLTDPVSIALGIGPGCIEAWKINDNLHGERR